VNKFKLLDDFDTFTKTYVAQQEYNESRLLKRQEKKARKRIDKVLSRLKKHKNSYLPEIKEIEEKIIPYLKRKKFLPQSYLGRLNHFERKLRGSIISDDF